MTSGGPLPPGDVRSLILAATPAATALLGLSGILPAAASAVLVGVGLLLGPGYLAWWFQGGPISRQLVALPAIAFTLSYVLLLPITCGFLFLGMSAGAAAWTAAGLVMILGVVVAFKPRPRLRIAPPPWWLIGILGVAVAVIFRATDGDQLTHAAVANFIKAVGRYPEVNPFLLGDVPLAPRWQVNGWTGWLGIVAHVSRVEAEDLITDLWAPVSVLLAASGTFLLVWYLAGRKLAAVAAFLGAAVLPLVFVEPQPLVQTRLWLAAAGADKAMGLLVVSPVAAVVLMRLFHAPSWRSLAGGGGAMIAILFIHPLMFVFTILLVSTYALIDALTRRALPIRRGAWLAGAFMPALAIALLVDLASPAFGVGIQDAQMDEIAVERSWGPITFLEPHSAMGMEPPSGLDARAAFVQGKFGYGPGRYMIVGGTMMPSWRVIYTVHHVAIILACLFVIFRAGPGRLRSWTIAATALAVVPFAFPPAAWLFARLSTPWVLWRFIWLLPLPLIAAWLLGDVRRRRLDAFVGILLIAVLATTFNSEYWNSESPFGSLPLAEAVSSEEGVVLLQASRSRILLLKAPGLTLVAGGPISGANNYPRERLEEGGVALEDSRRFFSRRTSPEERLEIMERYGVTHLIARSQAASRLALEELPFHSPEHLPEGFLLFRRLED